MHSKLMFLFFVLYHFMLSGSFVMAWKFGMGFLWGYILVQGFFGVLIFAPIRSSLSLEIWSTPLWA